jgi:urocanate hydratase
MPVADWVYLNFALNAVGGATWGIICIMAAGVGMGYSLHAGMVVVADGTAEADARLQRVLTYDPFMGIIRPCRCRI